MNCKVCHATNTTPITPNGPGTMGGPWWHCFECSCSSSEEVYNPALYHDFLRNYQVGNPLAESRRLQSSNVNAFKKYQHRTPHRDFLDVGHCDGAALYNMQEAGWAVHGFDVQERCNFGPHTTIAPEFRAALFPQQYAAIQCREVIEHVADWKALLTELVKALRPQGLLHLQTPRPSNLPGYVYIGGHLQIFHPRTLGMLLEEAGLQVLESYTWPNGQWWMTQKV